MGSVMSGSGGRDGCRAAAKRTRRAGRLLVVCALSFLATACANQVAQRELPVWQLDGTPAAPSRSYATAPAYSAEAYRSNDVAQSRWTPEPTYEYRGGRDPHTGLAKLQM